MTIFDYFIKLIFFYLINFYIFSENCEIFKIIYTVYPKYYYKNLQNLLKILIYLHDFFYY